jgi:hypothetical protein
MANKQESYVSDFGTIRADGFMACLGNHLRTKRWRYARNVLVVPGQKPPKEFICSKKCAACNIERALNNFAESVWLTGGRLEAIEITPPLPGTGPSQTIGRMKPLGPIPEQF